MTVIVKNNLDKIIKACEDMQVKSLYLFGSGSRNSKFSLHSDLDFLYCFKKDGNGQPVSGFDYFDLLFKLEEITGKNVDLIAEEKIKNKYFIERVNKEKILLYES